MLCQRRGPSCQVQSFHDGLFMMNPGAVVKGNMVEEQMIITFGTTVGWTVPSSASRCSGACVWKLRGTFNLGGTMRDVIFFPSLIPQISNGVVMGCPASTALSKKCFLLVLWSPYTVDCSYRVQVTKRSRTRSVALFRES